MKVSSLQLAPRGTGARPWVSLWLSPVSSRKLSLCFLSAFSVAPGHALFYPSFSCSVYPDRPWISSIFSSLFFIAVADWNMWRGKGLVSFLRFSATSYSRSFTRASIFPRTFLHQGRVQAWVSRSGAKHCSSLDSLSSPTDTYPGYEKGLDQTKFFVNTNLLTDERADGRKYSFRKKFESPQRPALRSHINEKLNCLFSTPKQHHAK